MTENIALLHGNNTAASWYTEGLAFGEIKHKWRLSCMKDFIDPRVSIFITKLFFFVETTLLQGQFTSADLEQFKMRVLTIQKVIYDCETNTGLLN